MLGSMSLEATNPTKKLCELCQSINIEDISRPEGLTLHPNLHALRICASSCSICPLAIESVIDQGNIDSGVVAGDEDWQDQANWDK